MLATPGLFSPAVKPAVVCSRNWVAARTATLTPSTTVTAGANASALFAPMPAILTGLDAFAARVSFRPAAPKSTAWLLAMDTTSTPASASVVRAEGGAANVNCLPPRGAPVAVMAVSRLSTVMSAPDRYGLSPASPWGSAATGVSWLAKWVSPANEMVTGSVPVIGAGAGAGGAGGAGCGASASGAAVVGTGCGASGWVRASAGVTTAGVAGGAIRPATAFTPEAVPQMRPATPTSTTARRRA
nr:hypothetical protein [Propioniciclava coleopterorum]